MASQTRKDVGFSGLDKTEGSRVAKVGRWEGDLDMCAYWVQWAGGEDNASKPTNGEYLVLE
jgi:hypothetical protein